MMPLLRSLFHDRVPRKHLRRKTTPLHQRRRPTFENLEERMMLAATLLNTPFWIERGPGPITNSPFVDLTGNGSGGDPADVAVGAIEAIAVDPFDSKHVFVGTVNGGIWETNDVNAASPVWTTTTDQLPSLAIGAIAISPVNSNRVYAGTGSFSSFGFEGGEEVGLYRSFDGGTTWAHIGFNTFSGMAIRSIIPTQLNSGGTIFVATVDSRGPGTGGIYRSDDFGNTWIRLSGAFGLPNAAVSHLASFAVNASTVGFYTAVIGPGGGIFRSMNNGQSWQSVTNNIATSVANATRIEFSVSPVAGKPVYAGLIDNNGFLLDVFRSVRGTDGINNNSAGGIDEPAEATWQVIARTAPDIFDRGSGGIHFAILADSTQNNIVYVGGNVSDGRANLFRGNSTTGVWTSLTTNTAPHPDVRDLVFSGTNILRADDGGIYRLLNPRGLNFPSPPTTWQSALGNLRNSEVISVALDNRNNTNPADDILLAGLFDNGSSERSATGQWATVLGGDGMITQAFDAGTSVHYFTTQQLLSFAKRVGDGDVVPLQRRIDEASGPILNKEFDDGLAFAFKTSYQVHATDPNRILVGSFERLYESFNGGDSFLSIGGVELDANGVPTPRAVPGLLGGGLVVSMAYGHADNPALAYVGTNTGDIFVRTEADGEFGQPFRGPFVRTNFFEVASIDGPSADDPLDIVVDANDPQRAYAVTNQAVFMTQNRMDWVRITDNLSALALPGSGIDLQSIELVNDDTPSLTDDVILAGGLGGVFRRSAAAIVGPKWSEYGRGLPNTLVMDMEYDQRSNTLLVGTLGRSAWVLPNVRSTIGLESRLQVTGTAGLDTIRLVRNANNPSLLDVFFNNTSATPSLTTQLSVLQKIQVTGLGGPDILEIQSTNGIVTVQNGIDFVGGSTDQTLDRLVLRNTTDTANRAGQFTAVGITSSLTGPLTFSGIEAVSIFFGSGSDFFDATAATIPVTLIGGPGIDSLRGGMGDDTLDGRDGAGNDSLFGGPGNDTALMDPGDFFNGGPDQDGIHFFGTPGNDHIRISRQVGPNGAQALFEQKKQVQVFNYVEGETISVFAGAGNDHVTVDASVTTWRAELFGQQGNDRLYGGPLNDLLDGGPGNDFLDGGAGDNVLIGGGGHDRLQNGHAPLVAQAAAGVPSVASAFAGTSTNSNSARLVQVPVQLDRRSRQLDLNRIDLNRAALARYLQQLADKNTPSSRAILLEANKLTAGLDDELLDALMSGLLSKDDGSITGTMDVAFATYDNETT
ncbi:MAG: hypothetical protein WD738_16295 [Pirellulales bacterium]